MLDVAGQDVELNFCLVDPGHESLELMILVASVVVELVEKNQRFVRQNPVRKTLKNGRGGTSKVAINVDALDFFLKFHGTSEHRHGCIEPPFEQTHVLPPFDVADVRLEMTCRMPFDPIFRQPLEGVEAAERGFRAHFGHVIDRPAIPNSKLQG